MLVAVFCDYMCSNMRSCMFSITASYMCGYSLILFRITSRDDVTRLLILLVDGFLRVNILSRHISVRKYT